MSRPTLVPLLAALLAAATSADALAQTSRADPTDLQAWYAVGLGFDMPARWEGELRYRARTVDNASEYRGSYITAELARRLAPGGPLTATAGYRLALVDDATAHRFSIALEAAHRTGATTLSLRPMLQYQHRIFDDDVDGSESATLLRTRARVRHRLGSAVAFYGSVEPYFNFGDGYFIDNLRNTAGVSVRYAQGRRIDLFYIYRPDFAKSYNRTFHVIGVDLDFTVRVR
jgi:hypothetical protein